MTIPLSSRGHGTAHCCVLQAHTALEEGQWLLEVQVDVMVGKKGGQVQSHIDIRSNHFSRPNYALETGTPKQALLH